MTERVCFGCGEPYSGPLDIVVHARCSNCDEMKHFGTREEYESA
jgi:hypothetical protein